MLTDDEKRLLRIAVELECVRDRLTRWNLWLRGLPALAPELIGADRCMSIESRYIKHTSEASWAIVVPADEGLEIERLMRLLPVKHALALKYAYVRFQAPLEHKCRAVGVGRSQFYRLIREGELMVRNHLRLRPSFQRAAVALLEIALAELLVTRNSLTYGEKGDENAAIFR